jgi:competence protein ComEC
MKKLISLLFILSIAAFPLNEAQASPGGTDSSGGHTCWTNCSQYGLETGEYHYHDDGGGIIRENEPSEPQPTPGLFTDTDGHWAEPAIEFLYNLDLVSGYSDGSFGINNSITRAEAAAIITRHLDLPASKPSFGDVSSKHWAYYSIGAVNKANIMGGYPDGSFRANDSITRAELAALLVRAYELSGKSAVNFNDVKISHWAYGAIQILVKNEITGGYPDNTFRASNNVTRAEFATFLTRIIKNSPVDIAGGEITASFIDVGQGDSTLIQTSTGKSILIDGGDRYSGDEVSAYLRKQGVDTIDLMVATHPDSDHIGGLVDILQNFTVKKVLDSGKVHTTDTYREYLTLIDTKNIPMEVPAIGEYIDFDEHLSIQVLNSTNESSDTNESSIVLNIKHEDVDLLLTGDASNENEQEMINMFNVDADVLKAGHHGSSTSSSLDFLQAVSPTLTILSYGENSYGHPDLEVVQRLQSVGVEIFSTYYDGNIVLKTGDNGYSIMGDK